MKKVLSILLAMTMIFAMSVPVYAANTHDCEVESCKDHIVSEGEGSILLSPELIIKEDSGDSNVQRDPMGIARSTSKPTSFWNIASKGIYHGSFTNVNGTIYTNYYFDTNGASKYYVRIDVWSLYPATTKFVLKGFCKDCNKLIGQTEDIETNNSGTGYLYYSMPTSGHETHMVYPAIQCTGSYAVYGTIDVNYTNSWS